MNICDDVFNSNMARGEDVEKQVTCIPNRQQLGKKSNLKLFSDKKSSKQKYKLTAVSEIATLRHNSTFTASCCVNIESWRILSQFVTDVSSHHFVALFDKHENIQTLTDDYFPCPAPKDKFRKRRKQRCI